MSELLTADELLKLARFQMLDSRNGSEEAKDKLLGAMADEVERLRTALQMIADETICPELFPDVWDKWTEAEQSRACAVVIATAALEGKVGGSGSTRAL